MIELPLIRSLTDYMPVSKSAKKALKTAIRRHEENITQRTAFKRAIKGVKKAVETGSGEIAALFSIAQSKLDKAAKNNTIHPNKAARLKSRLSKKLTPPEQTTVVKPKRVAAKKILTKKAA
jgi:small subunit ribosomal protein S20